MNAANAIYRNGQIELTSTVDWPDGTPVEVKPLPSPESRPSWLSLPPLDVGRFVEPTSDEDRLGEMLDDSRN